MMKIKYSQCAQAIKDNSYKYASVLIGMGVFVYLCVRAYAIAISHDEALTCRILARASYLDILLFRVGNPESNNHVINTALAKIFWDLLGNSEFAIRIPALIGYLLYFSGIYAILRLLAKNVLFVLGICLLITNPFLVDFFSCGRGYSLGLGFAAIGLYCMLRSIGSQDKGCRMDFMALAIASFVMSVVTLIKFLAMYVSCLGVWFAFEAREIVLCLKSSVRNFIVSAYAKIMGLVALSTLFLLWLYRPSVFKTFAAVVNDATGTRGFFPDVVGSLVQRSLYRKVYFNMDVAPVIMAGVLVVFAASFLILAAEFVKKKALSVRGKYLMALLMVFAGIVVAVEVQNAFLQFHYPKGRTAIYLLPLFFILVILIGNYIEGISRSSLRRTLKSVYYALIVIVLLHNCLCFNTDRFFDWQYDMSGKKFMQTIDRLTRQARGTSSKYKLGLFWFYEPASNYYRLKYGMSWIEPVTRKGPDAPCDFYYLRREDMPLVKKYNLRVIESYPETGTCLAVPVSN